MTDISILKIVTFFNFLASCLQTGRSVEQCRGYDPLVACPPIDLRHGTVCYEWKWDNSGWRSSLATLVCNEPYNPRTTRNMLRCTTSCFYWPLCSKDDYNWSGMLPECQQQAEATDLLSSSTTTTTIKTYQDQNKSTSNKSYNDTDNATKLVLLPVTILISRPSTVGNTNLSSARDGQNLFSVYVAVPVVVVVGGVVLVVMLIVRKRHQRKQNGIISDCGKVVRKEHSDCSQNSEAYNRNLQLNAIVDGCQEVNGAYTSLPIRRENGVYETILGGGDVPINKGKQPETIACGRTTDDKAYTSLCTLKENNAYSVLANDSIKLDLDKRPDTPVNGRPEEDKHYTSLRTLRENCAYGTIESRALVHNEKPE